MARGLHPPIFSVSPIHGHPHLLLYALMFWRSGAVHDHDEYGDPQPAEREGLELKPRVA